MVLPQDVNKQGARNAMKKQEGMVNLLNFIRHKNFTILTAKLSNPHNKVKISGRNEISAKLKHSYILIHSNIVHHATTFIHHTLQRTCTQTRAHSHAHTVGHAYILINKPTDASVSSILLACKNTVISTAHVRIMLQ